MSVFIHLICTSSVGAVHLIALIPSIFLVLAVVGRWLGGERSRP